MRIENSTVKIKNNNQSLVEKDLKVLGKGGNAPSFGAGGLGNGVITVMDAIDRGGLFASFVVQDFFGMNIPRTMTGLYRNSDITGELNYQEAAEVAIREFLSGPVMFAVPMLMIWAIKRSFGKANDVPVDVIRAMGDKFVEYSAGKNSSELSDVTKVKKGFYTVLFKDALSDVYPKGTATEAIEKSATQFADDILEYEKLLKQKKTTSFIEKLKGIEKEGTADAKLSSIMSKYAEIVKTNADNPSKNFLNIKISTTGNDVNKSINGFIVDMRNYTEDAVETISKKAKDGKLEGKDLQEFFKKFTDFRAGSRVLTNISMLIGTIAFCSIIPKLYQLSDKNPGLKGIEGDTQEGNKTEKLKDTPADVKENLGASKQVAFSGAIDSLGRVVSKKDGKLSKFFNEFEFDSYNLSFMGFLTACGIGVLLPRLYHAREENEYKEILFRDTTTILAIACLAKCVQQMVARACTKATGLALALKPKFAQPSKLKEYLAYLRPIKGHKVLNSAQLHSKYTNIHQYKDGIAGFAKFIDEQGGDVRKMFKIDSNALEQLKTAYNASAKAKSVAFEQAGNKDIIEAMTDVVKNGKASDSIENLKKIFQKNDNAFLRKAKIMNSSFNFAILFAVAPVVFGWFIPWLNELLTKKRQLEKRENSENNTVEKTTEVQQSKLQQIRTLAINNAKKPVAFKEFIAS